MWENIYKLKGEMPWDLVGVDDLINCDFWGTKKSQGKYMYIRGRKKSAWGIKGHFPKVFKSVLYMRGQKV